jgi:hypothetical protein
LLLVFRAFLFLLQLFFPAILFINAVYPLVSSNSLTSSIHSVIISRVRYESKEDEVIGLEEYDEIISFRILNVFCIEDKKGVDV